MFCIKLAVCLDPIPWTYFSLYLFCTQTVCVLFSLLPGDSPALDFLESLSEPISCFSWLQSTNQLVCFLCGRAFQYLTAVTPYSRTPHFFLCLPPCAGAGRRGWHSGRCATVPADHADLPRRNVWMCPSADTLISILSCLCVLVCFVPELRWYTWCISLEMRPVHDPYILSPPPPPFFHPFFSLLIETAEGVNNNVRFKKWWFFSDSDQLLAGHHAHVVRGLTTVLSPCVCPLMAAIFGWLSFSCFHVMDYG